MSFVIRECIKTDLKHVLNLVKELATFEKEPDAVEITIEDLERDGFNNNPMFKIYVAENENEIVGMALFYYRYSTWKGKTIHLEDLIVKQNMRGKGIGRGLYDKVLSFAFKNNLKRVEWVVLDWNTNAINFYVQSGAKILEDWKTVQMDEVGLKNYVLNL